MNSLKSWYCLFLLFALSLFGTRASYAKVVLTISKPALKPALVVTYRITEQDAAHLTVTMTVTNRQKTWYYVNAKKASHIYQKSGNFLVGPSQTRTINNVELTSFQSGSLAADSTLTKYKEVSWAVGIDAMYRVGMGKSLPLNLQDALLGLLDTLKSGASSDSDRKQLLSGLNAYTAALKRKDVEGCAQVMKSMIYNPLLTRELYDEDQATALKFKSTIEKLTTTKLLTLARGVAKSQIEALSALQTDVVTYSTKFVGSAPKLVVSNVRTNEGDFDWHFMTIDVKLSSGWWQPLSVNFSTSDGTAKADEDYRDAKETVYFSPGQTIQRIKVRILGDMDDGPDSAFSVQFSKPSKNLTIPKDTITVTIADDDKISTNPSNNGKIAYQLYGDIYVMNLDATNKTRLTYDGENRDPAFSPDGSKIAFAAYELYERGYHFVIYVMDANGDNRKPISDGQSPAFSPDGSKIVYDHNHNIYVMNADGTGYRDQLTIDHGYANPTFSPDGSKIAFTKRDYVDDKLIHNIYTIDTDTINTGGAATFFAIGHSVAFSPDGSKIATDDSYDLHIMNADGTGDKQLTDFGGEMTDYTDNPTFSPDGSKIAFYHPLITRDPEFDSQESIYVINPNGTNIEFLVDGRNPSWARGFVPAPFTPSPASPSPARSTFPSGGAS